MTAGVSGRARGRIATLGLTTAGGAGGLTAGFDQIRWGHHSVEIGAAAIRAAWGLTDTPNQQLRDLTALETSEVVNRHLSR